jgi:hypothetical protein
MLLLFVTVPALTDEGGAKGVPSAITNVGFLKDAPETLRKKFSMCDAFLKVEWIDKNKKIGYSRYDFYRDGKKYGGMTWAMVHLDEDHPAYDYNLERYRKKKGGLKELFAFIKRGTVAFDRSNVIIENEQDGKTVGEEFTSIKADWNAPLLTLADARMTVCIPYPDNRRMFIAEMKEVKKIYGETEIKAKVEEIRKSLPNLQYPELFGSYNAIDVNLDGKEDYVGLPFIVYSHGNQYYGMEVRGPRQDDAYTKVTSPTAKGSCELLVLGDLYLTTDGENFYLNNKCKLTEFTKKGETP